jgi:hypothetical protein
MGVFNLAIIDTTPGADGLFSPPAIFDGTKEDYLSLMRQRYLDLAYKQLFYSQIHFMANGGKVEYRGHFVEEAKEILAKIKQFEHKSRASYE